jgi:hypothetical protein
MLPAPLNENALQLQSHLPAVQSHADTALELVPPQLQHPQLSAQVPAQAIAHAIRPHSHPHAHHHAHPHPHPHLQAMQQPHLQLQSQSQSQPYPQPRLQPPHMHTHTHSHAQTAFVPMLAPGPYNFPYACTTTYTPYPTHASLAHSMLASAIASQAQGQSQPATLPGYACLPLSEYDTGIAVPTLCGQTLRCPFRTCYATFPHVDALQLHLQAHGE